MSLNKGALIAVMKVSLLAGLRPHSENIENFLNFRKFSIISELGPSPAIVFLSEIFFSESEENSVS